MSKVSTRNALRNTRKFVSFESPPASDLNRKGASVSHNFLSYIARSQGSHRRTPALQEETGRPRLLRNFRLGVAFMTYLDTSSALHTSIRSTRCVLTSNRTTRHSLLDDCHQEYAVPTWEFDIIHLQQHALSLTMPLYSGFLQLCSFTTQKRRIFSLPFP